MRVTLTGVTILGLFSCSSENDPARYIKWVEDPANGLHIIHAMDSMEYQIQFAPHEYLVLMNNKRTRIDEAVMLGELQQYAGTDYFIFRIARKNLPASQGIGTTWYGSMQDYLSFGLARDLRLLSNGDTGECVLYQFDGENPVTHELRFTLAFKATAPGTKELVFDDRAFTDRRLRFVVTGDAIASIPKLSI